MVLKDKLIADGNLYIDNDYYLHQYGRNLIKCSITYLTLYLINFPGQMHSSGRKGDFMGDFAQFQKVAKLCIFSSYLLRTMTNKINIFTNI